MSAITAVPYVPKHRALWDDFVLHSNNGTMFHLQQFLDYHPPGRFDFHHLLFFDGGRLIAVLPGGLIAPGVYESPVGASYGGFVLHTPTFDQCIGLADALIAYAREVGWDDVMLTAAPFVYHSTLTQEIDYALIWRGFFYECHYISSVIDLRDGIDPRSRYSRLARRSLRPNPTAPIRVDRSDEYDLFYPILLENKSRHDVRPTHSLADLHRLHELVPERLVLFNLFAGDEPIAGALNFVTNPRVFQVFYVMMRYDFAHLNPAYFLYDHVIEHARAHGFSYVDFGVSQDTKAANPMTPSMNLIRFKEHFGACGVMRSTLRWQREK